MRYKVSFFENKNTPIIEVVQGDSARVLEFEPTDYDIPEGAVCTYYVKRPSNIPVYNSASVDDNVVTVELTPESLSEVGENRLQVRIEKNDKILTSFTVVLLVREFGGIGAVESSSEANVFDQAVANALSDLETQAETVIEEVIESIPSDYTELSETVEDINDRLAIIERRSGLTDDIKNALLQIASDVIYKDGNGPKFYQDLYDALNPEKQIVSISAVYTQSGTVYFTDTLDSLKTNLVVTGNYDDSSTEIVTNYNLSGALTIGTSIITVLYNGKSTTFTVEVSDIIPSNYTRLAALVSQGAQYIDTGIDFTDEMMYEIEVSGLVRNATANTCAFGAFSTGSTYMVGLFLYADNSSVYENKIRAWFRGYPNTQADTTHNGLGFVFDTGTKYKCAQKGNKAWVDDVQLTNTFTDVTFSIGMSFVLFGRNSATSGIGGFMPCTIYSAKFYGADGTLAHDYIPCLDNSNVPCMYDAVTGDTKYNGGTGSFNYLEVA